MKITNIFRIEYWHLGIIKLDKNNNDFFKSLNNSKIEWLNYRYKDRFFADPFLLNHEVDNINILAEEYFHDERKGRIVKLTVNYNDLKIKEIETIIDEKTHLSFPLLYEGKIYPENYRSGGYFSYNISGNEIQKNLEFDKACIDPIIYNYMGIEYLFTSLPDSPFCNEYLFYKENGHWKQHPNSPIQTVSEYSRMAGNIFKVNNKLYRPVQDCKGSYGNKVHLMEITNLSPKSYKENLVYTIDSRKYKKFNQGLHTFNYYDGFILVDGYSYNIHILRRILTTIKRKLNKKNS